MTRLEVLNAFPPRDGMMVAMPCRSQILSRPHALALPPDMLSMPWSESLHECGAAPARHRDVMAMVKALAAGAVNVSMALLGGAAGFMP